MDELKPCLLPCNTQQLNDRINSLGLEIARMGENETLRVHKAFLIATLGYMEELLGMRYEEENHCAAPENKPLTLEQVKQLKPGTHVTIVLEDKIKEFREFEVELETDYWGYGDVSDGSIKIYARKPEQEEDDAEVD